jgi:hypothetical protein
MPERVLKPLWIDGDAPDPAYCNIRDAKSGPLVSARYHCEYLWIFFQHHADAEFRDELRKCFDQRYWEMYLTVSFILAGYEVTCPKPGPDVGIMYKGKRIWFEATSPTRGKDGSPDQVPKMKWGAPDGDPVKQDDVNDKIVLRYLNSISTKFNEQYAKWIAKGTVSDKDAFVIAINPREIDHDHIDSSPPRILQAAYTVGAPYAVFNIKEGKIIREGYEFRDHIVKEPKKDAKPEDEPAKTDTGVFQQKEYAPLSGLLCSRVDAANQPGEMGDDFQVAPNPHAQIPLPDGFRLRGTLFEPLQVKDGYQVTPR